MAVLESKTQFTEQLMSADDVTKVSMPMYEFQQAYSEFCYKGGYDEKEDFEGPEEQKVL